MGCSWSHHEQPFSSRNRGGFFVLENIEDVTGALTDHRAVALGRTDRERGDVALLDGRHIGFRKKIASNYWKVEVEK